MALRLLFDVGGGDAQHHCRAPTTMRGPLASQSKKSMQIRGGSGGGPLAEVVIMRMEVAQGCSGIHGLAVEIALPHAATESTELLRLLAVLNAFRDHFQVEPLAHRQNGFDDM